MRKFIDYTPPTIKFRTSSTTGNVFLTDKDSNIASVKIITDINDNLDKSPKIRATVFKPDSTGQISDDAVEFPIDGKTVKAIEGSLKGNLLSLSLRLEALNTKNFPYHVKIEAIDNKGNKSVEYSQIYIRKNIKN